MKNTSTTSTTMITAETLTGMSDDYRRGYLRGIDDAIQILRTVREMKQEGSADDANEKP